MASAPNLPVLIFLIVLLTQVIAWVGKTALQDAAFAAYSKVFLGKAHRDQRRLRKQVLEDKAELGRTSSQDEFAKWAKLKRKVDKGLADLERTNNTLSSARSSFAVKFSSLIWIVTTGASLVMIWWYRREPVFWLPVGWVPGPIQWVLRLPSAPKGSVSVGAWSTVCKQVLTIGETTVKSLLQKAPVAAEPAAVPEKAGMAPRPRADVPSAKIEEIEPDMLD